MAKGPNLRDLARKANVSPSTVSRVIAGNPSVDPEIRLKVRRTAKALGIDLTAKGKGQSKILAFLLANRDVLHSFQARVLLGAETFCTQNGWELLFMSFRYSPETPPNALHLPQLLNDRINARAVILGGNNHPNLFTALEERGLPFTVLGNNVFGEWDHSRCDVAFSDDITGAADATAFLISQRHRGIAFVGNLELPWFKRCAQGYEQAMARAGLPPRITDLRFDGSQLGYLATKAIFSKQRDVTAVLAGSDQVAAGVYEALCEMKIEIPAKVSVVGFNDTQGGFLIPPLTSVREFPEELGRCMAEFVIKRVGDPELPPREISIPTQLVHRASVATEANGELAPRPEGLSRDLALSRYSEPS